MTPGESASTTAQHRPKGWPDARPIPPPRAAALIAFPLALWLLGCFYFFGDIGRYSDDYTLSLRVLATGAYEWPAHPWTRWPYFWRPLHLALISLLATALDNHLWANHLFSAACHGLGAFMVGRLARQLGAGVPAAACAGVLVLCAPFGYEVPFWPATVSTSIATAILCAVLGWVARVSRSDRELRPARDAPAMFLAAFSIPCFFEQAAAGLALIPLVWLACRPAERRPRVGAASVLTASAGAACVLYIALLVGTAPFYARGSAESFAAGGDLRGRAAAIYSSAAGAFVGTRAEHHVLGSIANAWPLLSSAKGIIMLLICAVAAAAWVAALSRAGRAASGSNPGPLAASGWRAAAALLIGPALWVVSWLPVIAVKNNIIESRLLWIPWCGAAILIALLLDLLLKRRPRAAWGALPVVAALAIIGACGLLGFQRAFRDRWRFDERAMRQLKQMVPDPPAGTVFMPVRINRPAATTPYHRFNWAVDSGLSQPWSAWGWARLGYRREDVSATHLHGNTYPPLASPDEKGIVYISFLPGPFEHLPKGRTRLTWDRVVPFVVDRDGRVALVQQLTIEREGKPTVVVRPALVPPADNRRRDVTIRLR